MKELNESDAANGDIEADKYEATQENFVIADEEDILNNEKQESKVNEHGKIIWKYYKRLLPVSNKMAKCKVCREVKSYKTSITNLKMHFWLKHPDIAKTEPGLKRNRRKRAKLTDASLDSEEDESKVYVLESSKAESDVTETDCENVSEQNITLQSSSHKPSRSNECPVWAYFKKTLPLKNRMAKCRACRRLLSYKSTVTNLKTHLTAQHPNIVKRDKRFTEKYIQSNLKNKRQSSEGDNAKGIWEYLEMDTDDEDGNYDVAQNDDSENTIKFTTEIWQQYNHDDEQPTCNLCRNMVPDSIEQMKAHLEEQHPKVLDLITQKVLEAASDDENALDEDNTYTEIVYLEDEPTNSIEKTTKYIKRKPKNVKHTPLPKVKNERNISISSDEVVQKRKIDTPPPIDELDVFLKYVKVLLKKVPQECSQKLHLDIINLIMNSTQQSHKNIIIEAVNLNNVPNSNNVNVSSVIDKSVIVSKHANANDSDVTDNTRRVISLPVHNIATESANANNIPVPQLVMISSNAANTCRSIFEDTCTFTK